MTENISFIISQRIKDVLESKVYDEKTKLKIILELSKIHLEIIDFFIEDREKVCDNDNLTDEEIDFWNKVDDPLGMRNIQDDIYERRDLKARGII